MLKHRLFGAVDIKYCIKTYSHSYTYYFDCAIMSYAVFYAIKYSQLDSYSIFRIIKQLFFIISSCASMLGILKHFKWTLINAMAFICLLIIPLYLRFHVNSTVLVVTLLIMCAFNVPFSHIAKKSVHAILLTLGVVMFALAIGIVDDRLYLRNKELFGDNFAHDLGFKYYGHYAYFGMGLVQCLIYRWRKHLSIAKIVFLLILSYVFFILSSTRLQMYSCIAFISCIILLPYIPKILFNNKLTGFISILIYPSICFILYYVSKYSILSLFLDNFSELNQMMSGRLRLNEEAFLYYDANLWGNIVEFDTEEGTNTYFYIDSGYLHTLLESGIVYTGIIMLLYSVLFYKVYKAKAYFLFIWLVLYSLICISNGLLTSILANPILLLAFSSVENISYDYELGIKRRKVASQPTKLVPTI